MKDCKFSCLSSTFVFDVHKSRDGLKRSADVCYNDTVKERPVAKLCLLEAACDVECE